MTQPKRRFTYEGTTYDLITRPLFPELDWVEKQAGESIEDMSATARQRVLMLLSVRRAQLLLTWEDFDQLSPADFVMLEPEPEAEPDPQPAVAEDGSGASPVGGLVEASTGPSPSSSTSTGSTSSPTSDFAPGSTTF
jgi:hypothetical protein